jgi:hypothetical protein
MKMKSEILIGTQLALQTEFQFHRLSGNFSADFITSESASGGVDVCYETMPFNLKNLEKESNQFLRKVYDFLNLAKERDFKPFSGCLIFKYFSTDAAHLNLLPADLIRLFSGLKFEIRVHVFRREIS